MTDLPSRRSALTAGLVMALGAGLITTGVIVGAADGPARTPHRTGNLSLVAYDSCAGALQQLKDRIMPHVGPYGLDFGGRGEVFTADEGRAVEDSAAGKVAAPEAPGTAPTQKEDHSTTNVHEAGVDEPDLVKTDGKRVVSIADGVLRVVDVASRTQTAAVRLDGPDYPTELLVAGDRALVMTSTAMVTDLPRGMPGETAPTDTAPYGSQLVLVDLTGAGKVLGTLAVDGSYLDARQVGSVARVVVHSQPRLPFRYPDDGDKLSALLDNEEAVTGSTIQDWLPRYELRTGGATRSGQLTGCADVSHPADYTATGMLTVLTVDLRGRLGTGDPVTIVADGSTVYGTERSLYVADDHSMSGAIEGPPASARTELYQFDISGPGKPVHVASGAVDGSLLNQYSLSEYADDLRVATTTYGRGSSQSMITVLRRRGNELTQVGQVGGLGAGERIYAVRYFGDTAYVVTFRQTDPLYTVDLRDPAAPKVTGELKIPGYSAYLHPAGDGRLIGVGQEADESGGAQGAQVSLFDTSDPAGARRIAQYHLPYAWTEAESDPHAFLYWPAKGLLVLPISGGGLDPKGGPDQGAGALVLKVREGSFDKVGVLTHDSDRYGTPMAPRRAMVIGDELWTVSEAGILVNDLDSLGQLAWLPFG
ncbi:beta-propeller domain-containing protein [Actinophytocola sp.]|uniref:beta-propeller domain-containing protein n=1 Tax=Actinophytocola sp. TaxID=1872138 RepID=UPI00389A5EC9